MTNDTTTPGAGEELLPCPFCASTNIDPEGWASHNPATGESKVGPACDDCGGSASVDLWNSRPTPRAAASVKTASGNLRCKACNSPRAVAPCHKCGGPLFEAHPDWEDTALPDIGRVRELAREVGYAVGVHGSLERDLDLIAAPWTPEAVSAPALAAHIAKGMNGRVLDDVVQDKPHGRWSCNIDVDGWFKLIDLSVMQPTRAPDEIDAAWDRMRGLIYPGAAAAERPAGGNEEVAAQIEGDA